jgi:sugar lactone lactonase YvrE
MHTAHVLVNFDNEEDRFLPEGPRAVTLFHREAIVWVNIQTAADATRGAIHAYFFDNGERRRWQMPARPGFVFPTDAPNTLLVGMEKAIGTLNLATGLWTPFAKLPDTNPRTIINDGEIVPGGRAIVFGTKDTLFQYPIAHLYLFTLRDHQLSVLAPGQTCSNGKVFSGDGSKLFDIDTPKMTVVQYAFDVNARTLTPTREAIDLRDREDFPDGMCDVGDGTVIIAFYNPRRGGHGVADRFDLSTGKFLEVWETPDSPRVTCPLLTKRNDKMKLILTTATEGMSPQLRAEARHAGNLFITDTNFTTIPEPEIVRL